MTEQTKKSTRLSRIHTLLMQRGSLTVRELSEELDRSPRTIQRDMQDLELELGVPLVYQHRRWSILAGSSHPLSPVRLTLHESRAIYFALRAFSRTVNEREPDCIEALLKIADTLPRQLALHIRRSVDELRNRPDGAERTVVYRRITEAWVRSQTVSMSYRSAGAAEARTLTFDPYFLDATQSGTYVVGYSHEHGETRVFKLDRVESVDSAGPNFEPPELEDITSRLSQSWGGAVIGGESQFDVVVDFTPQAAPRIRESHWHPTQRLSELDGGGVRLQVNLPSLLEFTPWVRGWGPDALVVQPAELRDEVAATLRAAANRYEG